LKLFAALPPAAKPQHMLAIVNGKAELSRK